ncbi:uncharacterized protein LOC100833252 isoform X2 [Brachypodium distachyon]|uniref:Uncharacterized protein n=1 Tax=Brachypodium distachyon TaxID=15368 RepID=A0A0Q3GIM2_BRADI|nr:uncharacterized protein LOC100833252 isoform X2 [Brachypodium distachyon]KQK10968.1 hypothetical protein BRADI_2g57360v3 [Brachypodium distachyon]KQK10969.1 hypothetical protein BRADI_2g57360v3 [Brachypodium distachyon]|eukprot:XP_014754611.1 uncharacterized protein LOC100833252 isoform X2 [Brachypodium distachyon]
MDAGGTSKSGRPGRRPKMPPKLKFKPKVPVRKVKKSTAEKPQLEETLPIDEELMKRLRTGRGDAKTLSAIKEENSAAQSSHPMPSPETGFSLPLTQSGGQKQVQPKKALQIPRSFPVAANPEMFYDDEDEEDDDEDEDNVELQENQPSSSECNSVISSQFGTTGTRQQNKNVLIQIAEISSFAKNIIHCSSKEWKGHYQGDKRRAQSQ